MLEKEKVIRSHHEFNKNKSCQTEHITASFFFFFFNGGMVLEGYGRRKPQTFLCVLILARCVGKITFKYRMKNCGPSESVPIWAIDISETVE